MFHTLVVKVSLLERVDFENQEPAKLGLPRKQPWRSRGEDLCQYIDITG